MPTPVPALLRAAAAGDTAGVGAVLIMLVVIFVATKLLGELAQRFGQPAVLGELIAGVLLGASVFGLIDPAHPVIHTLSELGVIILLFVTGLHTETRTLVRVGPTAVVVALAGVVLPFVLGYGGAVALGVPHLPALVCGAALCATSIGISARVMSEIGVLDSPDGRVVLGAAVIDDVIGLILLAIVASLVTGADVTVWSVSRMVGVAIGFLIAAIVVGGYIATVGHRVVRRMHSAGTLGIMAIAFAFFFAWLAELFGSAMIIGAFAAGLVLDDRHDREEIQKATTTLGHFFVPIFFAAVGASVDLGALADSRALLLGAVLVVAGIVGKMASGYAPFRHRGNKLLIGIAMVPRGEVGLVFASMGLATGAIDPGVFGALMIMVLVTTLVTPPALARVARRRGPPGRDYPGSGGIDDLAAGTSDLEVWPESADQPPPRGTPRSTRVIRRRS